jgi:hypothetical protein
MDLDMSVFVYTKLDAITLPFFLSFVIIEMSELKE